MRFLRPGLHRPRHSPASRRHLAARLDQFSRAAFAIAWLGACASCAPPPSGPPTSAQRSAFTDQAHVAFLAMKSCDDAAQHATASGPNYDAALAAQSECEKTANTLVNFRFDGNVGQQFQDPLNASVAACWAAYDAKARRLAKLASQANGAVSPDPATDPKAEADQVEGKVQKCVGGFMQNAHSLGFKTDGVAPAQTG